MLLSYLRRLLRFLRIPGLIAGGLGLLLISCQSKLIYFPRPYGAEDLAAIRPPNYEILSWVTREGKQQGYLAYNEGGPAKSPARLWIVCAGNGSLALDLRPWLESHLPREDAVFYLDYPGYGSCEGSPTPKTTRDSIRVGLPLALAKLGWTQPTHRDRLRIFGHSLGAANALQAADLFGVSKGVLISPFTSMSDMVRVTLKFPLGPLLRHPFDNVASLRSITAQHPQAHFHVFHGLQDEVIPASQSQELKRLFPENIQLSQVEGGRHNDLLVLAEKSIGAAVR